MKHLGKTCSKCKTLIEEHNHPTGQGRNVNCLQCQREQTRLAAKKRRDKGNSCNTEKLYGLECVDCRVILSKDNIKTSYMGCRCISCGRMMKNRLMKNYMSTHRKHESDKLRIKRQTDPVYREKVNKYNNKRNKATRKKNRYKVAIKGILSWKPIIWTPEYTRANKREYDKKQRLLAKTDIYTSIKLRVEKMKGREGSVLYKRSKLECSNKEMIEHIHNCYYEGCKYCGEELTIGTYNIEHIIPLFEGGTHSINNIQTLCKNCHRIKSREEMIINRELRKKLSQNT